MQVENSGRGTIKNFERKWRTPLEESRHSKGLLKITCNVRCNVKLWVCLNLLECLSSYLGKVLESDIYETSGTPQPLSWTVRSNLQGTLGTDSLLLHELFLSLRR